VSVATGCLPDCCPV